MAGSVGLLDVPTRHSVTLLRVESSRILVPPPETGERGIVHASPAKLVALSVILQPAHAAARLARDDPGGDANRRDQAGWISQALPGDVERGSVRHARADNRQPQGDVDGPVEADGLERDVALVVVHGHDGVIAPASAR